MGKWLAGIAATVIAAVVIWYLTKEGGPFNQLRDCAISGSVHASAEPHDPLANVTVLYLPQDGSASELARTSPDGEFKGACPASGAYPIAFELNRSDWAAAIVTGVAMTEDGTETVVNLYVDREYAEMSPADRARVATVAGYAPVYLLATEPDAIQGRLIVPDAAVLNDINAIDNQLLAPDVLRLEDLGGLERSAVAP
jgi:hypothetical protein